VCSSDLLNQIEQEYRRAVALYGPEHPDVLRLKRQIASLTNDPAAGGSELAQLEAQLASLKERYSDQHPDVVSLRHRIEALKQSGAGDAPTDPVYLQLRAQIHAINSNVAGLRQREQELHDRLAELQGKIAQTPQVERQYQDLQRQLQTA